MAKTNKNLDMFIFCNCQTISIYSEWKWLYAQATQKVIYGREKHRIGE